MAYMKDSTGRRLDSFKVPGVPANRHAFAFLTAPNATTAAGGTVDLTQRSLIMLPVGAARWRIGFLNNNLRSATTLTTPVTVTGVWTGSPVYESNGSSGNNRWAGHASAALTARSGALSVPIDKTRVWSDWIEADPFEAGVAKVISWGITAPASGTGVASGNSYQGVSAAGSANAANATLTSPTIGTNSLRLDVAIEYEFSEAVQVILFPGDSNTVGYATAAHGYTDAGALPHESVPGISAQMGGFVAINLGCGSASTPDYGGIDGTGDNPTYPMLWDRVDLASVDIDAAVVALGTNDGASGLSTFVPAVRGIDIKLREDYGIKRIYWATIPPRSDQVSSFARLTAAASAGATSITIDTSLATGTVLIGSGYNREKVTISAVTGSGPYTATVTALANAHAADEPCSVGAELARRDRNNFLRNIPDGIAGLIDYEKVLEAAPDSPYPDARFVASDGLHFVRGGNFERARTVVSAGVAVRFE
jgi:hypothetical protein